MGIVREISPELDPVEFPDNMDEAAVDAFMAQRGRELRQGLIARRQAQLAAETEGDEALAYREGKVSPWEYWGSVARELPQEGMRQAGQLLRGTGQYLASSPMPRERGEMGVVDLNRRLAQRTPQEIDRDVEGSMLRQLGTEIVADAPERFPTLPGVRESLPSQVSAGIGSVAALLPAGLTGPAAPFVGGAMYGLSAGEDFADDAEQVINSRIAEALAQGNTSLAADLERRKFDMKNMARAAGRGVGTLTQALFGVGSNIRLGKSQIGGIGARLAERMVPKSAPAAVQNAVRGAVEGGLTEAAQEGTEQILGNAAALAVYDPNRGIMDDVAQSALVGGLTGKVVGGAFGSRGQNRDPLPASRAAVAGEVVPGTEIPQDIGAPDLTLEDLGDLLPVEAGPEAVAQPSTPVPATQETPENMGISQVTPVPEAGPESAPETPAVDSPTLSPATAAETTTAPEKPASPEPSSSAEGVTGEKPKRTRKAKRVAIDDAAGVEAAVAPAPVAPAVAPAPTPTIPPDDTAMEAATAAAMAPRTPAPVRTAPDEGIAERAAVDEEMTRATTRVPEVAPAQVGMPDEGIAATAAADAAMEQATRRAGETPAAAAMSQAPEEGIVGSTTPKIGDEAKKQEKRNRLSQLARAYTNRKEKSIADALKASGEQGTVEFIGKRKDKLIVSPEPASTAGEWRVTQIDDRGPVTHHTFKTRTAAIRAAAGDSFSEFVSGPEYHAAGDYKVSRVRKSKQAAPIAPAAEPPAAQAAEVSTPEAVKQSKPPMAPKAQKAFLLEEIDKALEEAPDPESRWEELADKWNASPEKAAAGLDTKAQAAAQKAFMDAQPPAPVFDPFIIIEVPGNGTFKINNTKRALKAFKERAKKFPTDTAGPTRTPLPAKGQSKPAAVGENTKESFLASAKEFVSDDPNRQTVQFVMSDGKRSAATDGRVMLIWNKPLGGTSDAQALFDTAGKPTKLQESWKIPAWQQIVPKTAKVIFKKLNTERLFSIVKQATAGPSVINVEKGTRAKPQEVRNIIRIVKNPDGSIGLFGDSQFGEYVHNVQQGAEKIATLNPDLFMSIIQASRRMGSETVSLSIDEAKTSKPVVVKWDGAEAVIMPMDEDKVKPPASFTDLLSESAKPDILERALNAAIEATDRKNATFSDPFLIAAVGLPVLNAALRIVRRVYLKTRDLARAKRQGMRLIRRQLRSDKQADLPRIEEAFNQLVEGTAEKPGPDQIEAFQAADGTRRQKSRGLFTGDVTVDTDAEWQAGAERWINQFNGNIRRAFEAARSTDYATTGLNPAAQDYVFGRLLELTEIQANAARNDVDALRALNLQKEIADAMRLASSEAGKALGARALVQNRILWMFPVLNYRNLIREAQKRLPFPDVVADEVRTWLQESGRRAVQEMRNAMTDADKVFARELKTTVRDMRVVWRDVMTASVESQEAMRRKILEELVKAPELKGLSRQGYIDIANLLGKAWERERARIFAAEFRKQVPLPTVKEDVRRKLFTAIPDVLKWANLGLLDNEAFRNAVAPKFGVAKFDGETAKKLNTMAQQAQRVGGVNRNRIIAEMYDTMQREGGVRWPDIVRDYWYAAVLGAVNTQVDNALGVINGALNTVMGMAMSPPEVRKAMGKAYKEGFGEAIADFFPILWRGDVARAINFNPEQPANTLNALSKSGNLFARGLSVGKYVSRLMTALDQVNALSTDQAMKAYALGRRLPVEHVRRYMMPSENVLRTARLKAESEGTPPNLMRKRVREIVQESIPVEVLISSKDIRELVTFTNQPKGLMGALYRGVQEMEKKAPGFKVLSGTNFLRFAANYSNEILNYVAPVALYRYYVSAPSRAEGRLGLKMGQEERQLILAKLAVGTALGTFAAALFLGDDDDEKDRKIDITGSFKSLDPNKRKQLLSEGRAPYSIRIGDKYVSYRQLPFGGVLGAIGELRDRQLYNPKEWNQESIARKFVDGAFAGSLIVRDSPAISSFTEFLGTANAYKYDMNEQVEKSLPKYIARLGGSFIPRIAKEIDAWADPTIYKANTGHEFFLQQMPIFRRELGEGPVLNVLGEPVQVERYPWSRWIKTRKEDKAWSTLGELASKGVFMPVPSVTVKVLENGKRREMTPAESYRYQQRVGQAYRKFVEDNAERLLRMKPDEATDFIDTQTERIRSRIRAGGA